MSFKFNLQSIGVPLDQADSSSGFLELDQTTPQDTVGTFYLADVFKTLAGTVTRTDNYISQIAKTGGKTYTITRVGGYISTVTDTVKTLTITRNASNQITSWTIT